MALEYHRLPRPGKLAVMPTKPLATQRDLALTYSPGVAAACQAIVNDRDEAVSLTGRHPQRQRAGGGGRPQPGAMMGGNATTLRRERRRT